MISVELRGPLEGVRDDLIKYLGPIVGRGTVASSYDRAVAELRAQAEGGARAGVKKEIPTIKAEVRKEATSAARSGVKPMVIGALAASAVAGALGFVSLIISIKKSRG